MLEEVNVMDLKAFDETVYQILNIMRNLEGNGITPETFGMAFDERFTTTDSSGATIELVPGGSEIVVTFENAK